MVDRTDLSKQTIEAVENNGIVFIDEIDKICGGGGEKNGPNVSREGVQRDLLPLIEGCSVKTKYGMVKTDHILFITSGAFQVSSLRISYLSFRAACPSGLSSRRSLWRTSRRS